MAKRTLDKTLPYVRGSIRATVIEVPRNLMGIDPKGHAMTYALNVDEVTHFRQLWADVERFGTFKRGGTLEEFFRQRREARDA